MHIFKSRNPIWLIIDILIAVWCWKASITIAAIFFTMDSIIQFAYTFFPDMVDVFEKNKKYRVFYSLFLGVAIYYIFLEISLSL